MIWLAVLLTILTIILGALVCLANGMSDAPSQPFQGGGMIVVILVLAAVCWAAWASGVHLHLGVLLSR